MINQGAEAARQRHGDEHRIERPNPGQGKRPIRQIAAQHQYFAMRHVQQAHRAVNQIEAERNQPVNHPEDEGRNRQLTG